MASIGQLVRTVAEVSGLEENSVKLIARYLREAGLIAQQSTGGGAARMTPADAVALLIAVNASPLAKTAVETVETFSDLFGAMRFSPEVTEADLISLGRDLLEIDEFGDVFERLIALSMPVPEGLSALNYDPSSAVVRIIIKFERPDPQVRLFVTQAGDWPDEGGANIATIMFRRHESDELKNGLNLPDRKVEVTISNATISAVANILAE